MHKGHVCHTFYHHKMLQNPLKIGNGKLTLMMLGKVKKDLAIFDGKILKKLYYVRRLIFQPCLPKDLIISLNPPFPQKNNPNFNIFCF